MFGTILILSQLLLPGYTPVATLEYTQPEGIVLQPAQPTVVATFKNEQPKPIATFKYEQPKGIKLAPAQPTIVKTWTLQ